LGFLGPGGVIGASLHCPIILIVIFTTLL